MEVCAVSGNWEEGMVDYNWENPRKLQHESYKKIISGEWGIVLQIMEDQVDRKRKELFKS